MAAEESKVVVRRFIEEIFVTRLTAGPRLVRAPTT